MKAKIIFPKVIVCFAFIASCKKDLVDNALEPMSFKSDQKLVEINFNPGSFSNSTLLTNNYFPYQTGRKYIFEAETPDGLERNEIERIETFKEVMGISVAVIRDKVWVDGVLEEDTRDWFAQDDNGNVWYMGEDVDNYNPDGSLRDHEGAWEAGVNGAIAGIIMLANPRPGNSYQQEFSAGIAEDNAKVVALGLTVQVPLNTYLNCLKTKEWSGLENGSIEYKFYAPGVGLVKEKTKNTVLELIAIEETRIRLIIAKSAAPENRIPRKLGICW